METGKVTYSIQGGLDFQIPQMFKIRQKFDKKRVEDPYYETLRTLQTIRFPVLTGKRIGITAGSRKLANLSEVLMAIRDFLREKGALPFIIPAMGSHGGATAEGQLDVLRSLGLSERDLGMPVISSMETEQIGTLSNGFPVWCSKTALEADGVIVVGRVKFHTSIKGPIESGLCKMMVVGLGKHKGAAAFHKQGYEKLAGILPEAGKIHLEKGYVLCGLALVENALDETSVIEAVPPDALIHREAELLEISKSKMPRFFLDEIDVLVVKNFGKDISGAGLDPNITGRAITSLPMTAPVPIRTIVALNLTEASHGNATGIGGADITTKKVIEQIDFKSLYTNVFTSGALPAAKLPIFLNTEEEAVKVAIRCTPGKAPAEVRIVYINDTLHMEEILVSEAYKDTIEADPRIEVLGPCVMELDKAE